VSAVDALLVGSGGACGALARYLVSARLEARTLDTFVVNVCGSFALGVVLAMSVGEGATLAAGTGFCGAFTTFSSFAVETVRAFETGDRYRAFAIAAGTLAAALVAVWLGSVAGSSACSVSLCGNV
jgi:CrcB protein